MAVLGGAGFIGSHLVDRLLEEGHQVVVVDDLSKGRRENLQHHLGKRGFEFHVFDVRDTEKLFSACRGVDAVVNLVARKIPRYGNVLETLTLNTDSTRAALELARREGALFITASTSDVYGKSPEQPLREDGNIYLGPTTSRRWAYAVTKIYDEFLTMAYGDELGLPYVILRFFGAYGPRMHLDWWGGPHGVFIDRAHRGLPLEIHGDGRQTRAFTYISDTVDGIYRALTLPEAQGEIFNIGNPEEISIVDLARLIWRLSGREGEPPLEFVPYTRFVKGYEDVRRRVPDYSKAKRILGWEPKVSLEEGLKKTISWYREFVGWGSV